MKITTLAPLWVFLLLICTIVTAQDIVVPYEQFTLPNGLNVILHKDNTVPRVSVNMWYHVGSGSEKPGRTGFAHLFEHILFEGSQHVPEGKFDQWLEAAGADNNGSTTEDRTNYYEDLPSNALDLALFLESDRMGYLTQSLNATTVDGQRDVVKNERRQSYENRPYAKANLELPSFPSVSKRSPLLMDRNRFDGRSIGCQLPRCSGFFHDVLLTWQCLAQHSG